MRNSRIYPHSFHLLYAIHCIALSILLGLCSFSICTEFRNVFPDKEEEGKVYCTFFLEGPKKG